MHNTEPNYDMDLDKIDTNRDKLKNSTLDAERSSRRKSIEDNFMVPNVKFVKPTSRANLGKGAGKGMKTERFITNDTSNSKLNTDDDSHYQESMQESSYFKRKSNYSTNISPVIHNRSSKLTGNAIMGLNPTHNRLSNRSFDKNSGQMTLGYKQYVGDISKLTLPSKLDQKPSHPGLNKNAETQRLAKQIKERQENDEIAQGKVEIVVDSVQTHIQLILRLVKAAYQSLDEYKKDAE